MFEVLISISKSVSESATGVLIVAGTLLAMMSLRNGHLAERARANTKEIIHDVPKLKLTRQKEKSRIDCLKDQNKLFLQRYAWTSRAFILLCFAIVVFGIAAVLGSGPIDSKTAQAWGGGLALLATAAALPALGMMIYEFWTGPNTLRMNCNWTDDGKK